MKLYTRQGDAGQTALFGGQRVEKNTLRVEAYGGVDELNSAIGFAAVVAEPEHIKPVLMQLQPELFELGSALCTPPGETIGHVKPFNGAQVERLEREIDRLTAVLEPMRHFVLPGGTESAARLHLARTVCRRAERQIVALAQAEPVDAPVLSYINRLSDLLFAMARRANQLAKVADIAWKP
ncbi:MAG: cob(I)yrinic acid a,c-diamide adenosyltransferase [Phycisphaeraceae bacterium]